MNSPSPLAKNKRTNLDQTKPETADARIQRELTSGMRNNKNSRKAILTVAEAGVHSIDLMT